MPPSAAHTSAQSPALAPDDAPGGRGLVTEAGVNSMLEGAPGRTPLRRLSRATPAAPVMSTIPTGR